MAIQRPQSMKLKPRWRMPSLILVRASPGESLFEFLLWWLMIVLGLTFLGWAIGLVGMAS